MGTRNLTMVVKDGEYRVAQYGQWDGYPSGQGATVLAFLRDEMDRARFEAAVGAVRAITEAEWKALWVECGADPESDLVSGQVSNTFQQRYPWLDRDCGADVLKIVQEADGDLALKLSVDFAKDSLFCEWAYVVDLDRNVLEVYHGFNTEPLGEADRFFSDGYQRKEYFPVRLLKSYSLDALPTDGEFFADFREDDEEEEEEAPAYYTVAKAYTFTVPTAQDSVLVPVAVGKQVQIDSGHVYVRGKAGSWVLTSDAASAELLAHLEEIEA